MNTQFEIFSPLHFGILMSGLVILLFLIRNGRKAPAAVQIQTGIVLAGLTFSSLIIETMVKFSEGAYRILDDLPLYLCDLVAMFLPFILYTQDRKWIGIIYFWALAGTLQALITPDVEQDFPSFHFFRYFITHGGIVITMIYVIVVWKIKIVWKDFFNAILYIQVYLLVVHIVNYLLNSNYSYTLQKPVAGTVLDFFGPWPWYILGAELLMIVLFLLLMLPFILGKKSTGPGSVT